MSAEKSAGMGLRLSEQQKAALEEIAERSGLQVAQLIRFAIDALLAHYERYGQRLVLPVDFAETPGDWAKVAEQATVKYGRKKSKRKG